MTKLMTTKPEKKGFYWRRVNGGQWVLLSLSHINTWKYCSSGSKADVGLDGEEFYGPVTPPSHAELVAETAESNNA